MSDIKKHRASFNHIIYYIELLLGVTGNRWLKENNVGTAYDGHLKISPINLFIRRSYFKNCRRTITNRCP